MNEEDKLLETWVEERLKKLSLESPPAHFSNGVMDRIRAEKAIDTAYFKYRPLISRPVWAILIFGFVGLISVIYFSDTSMGTNQLPTWVQTIPVWLENLHFHFQKLKVPSTTGMAILIFSFMALIEIPIIQKFVNRRINGQT